MRVIAGTLGGRSFESPRGNRTHPMSEKARGAIFNALGDIDGLTVLDAFAGSGALGIEAISRGAAHVTAIDADAAAIRAIATNAVALSIADKLVCKKQNIGSWSDSHTEKTFDIVLADPPYNDIRPGLLQKLVRQVAPGGVYVLSWPGNEPVRPFVGLEPIKQKSLGDIQLVFYRKIQ